MNLKEYIRGNRHGKDANRLEREALNDAFLHDAIDGFDAVPGDHFSTIEKLEKRIVPSPNRVDKRVWMWVAAAVFVLLVGIPFLLWQPECVDMQTTTTEEYIPEQEITTFAPAKDSVFLAEETKIITEKEAITEKIEAKTSAPASITALPSEELLMDAEKQSETFIIAETNRPVSEKLQKQAADIRIRGISSDKKTASSDEMVVLGRIVDESGEPIIGASVQLHNTNVGTVSNIDGYFALVVPKNEKGTLTASYVGMKRAEIPMKEYAGDIVMKEDTDVLSEVVVTGFGTQRKHTYTGAVSAVKETVPVFGEAEFERYFAENYDKTICIDQAVSVLVEFYVNEFGRVSGIRIKENSCLALESEIKRLLLGSPKWSRTNRKVTLNFDIR